MSPEVPVQILPARPSGALSTGDRQSLSAARRAGLDRLPCGARLSRFRWAEVGDALWLIPSGLPDPATLHADAATGEIPLGARRGAWPQAGLRLATAARQDLWRALRTVPGLRPAVRVRRGSDGASMIVTVVALTPRPGPAGLGTRLAALFDPGRTAHWVRFSRHGRRRTRPRPHVSMTMDEAPCSPRS